MPSLTTLLLCASFALMAFSGIGVMLIRSEDRHRRSLVRLQTVARSHRPATIQPVTAARLTITIPTATLRSKSKLLIGMDPYRADPYRLKPIVVIPLALIPGYVMQWLLHGLLGPWAWLLVPVTALWVTRGVFRGDDAKRTAILYRQFPDALAMIVRAVRVGIPVSEAIRAVANESAPPTSREFGRLHDQIGVGTALEDGLREMSARNRLPEYRFFATALALQSQTGGGLTETLENLAEVVRKRIALQARGYALASEARTSAGVLTALPVFSGLALAVLNPDYIATLFEPGKGQTLFGVTVLWLGAGVYVMRLLIRKSLS